MSDNFNFKQTAYILKEILSEVEDDLPAFNKYVSAQVEHSSLTGSQRESATQIKIKLLDSFKKYKERGKITDKKVIGLVDGVFDMAHFGHFNAIRQASLCVDELIVGINADESVHKCKGFVNKANCIHTRGEKEIG